MNEHALNAPHWIPTENQKMIESERSARRGSPPKSSCDSHRELLIGPSLWRLIKLSFRKATPPMEWTDTHGFYVVMGGLVLYKDKQPLYTLQYSTMERLYRAGQIDLPVVTKAEIMERSKDGVVSKTMALFQVVYFFQDYVRRWKRERSVIDLEIVTMIYIIINAFTFILYWHKPFYILLPTKVQLKPEPKKKNSGKRSSANSHPS